jgi:pimeloyl-ACP methyl ester carboxylesterase
VVLVHGTMDRSASFGPVLRQLTDRRAVTYDRRGWGRSRSTGGTIQLNDHVQDLLSVLESAAEPPVLAAHSFGGIIALCAAARRPASVRAVVVYEPPVRWLPWWPVEAPWERVVREATPQGPAAVATAMFTAVTGRPPGPDQQRPGELEANGRSLLAEMGDPSLDEIYFDLDRLAGLRVVVGAGSESQPHHIEVARRLALLLDRGVFVELPGAGHSAHVTHPELFARLIETAR